MYTAHGWHIPFTHLDDDKPERLKECGGPRICSVCTIESLPHTPAFKGIHEALLFEHAAKESTVSFQERARDLVVDYFNEHAEKTDDFVLTREDTYVVWFVKVLGCWKALISTNVPDGMYYEVTYNGEKRETYLDAYKKFRNVRVPDEPEPAVA